MNSPNSILISILPLISTVAYMVQSESFNWLTAIPFLLPLLLPLATSFPSSKSISDFFMGFFNKAQGHQSFQARIRLRDWNDDIHSLVRNFSIVLWDWNRKNLTVNCKHMMEESFGRGYYSEELTDTQMPHFIDNRSNQFWHVSRPTIRYSMWMDSLTDRDGNVFKDILLRIEFTDPDASPNSVVEHIEFLMEESRRLVAERKRVQRVLVSTSEPADPEQKGPALTPYEFHTTSSFDNFFCEEATLVRQDLRHFLEDKKSYQRIGRPWTYTVLNEGPPGVGKTKLVKAIAALTGYTLIVINLSHMKTTQMLYEMFHKTTLAGETVPHDKRIYYIPELDTQMMEVVKKRNEVMIPTATAATVATAFNAFTAAATAATAATAAAPTSTTNSNKPMAATDLSALLENKKPTLCEILNILDGVPERHGHILILDTNHISELDTALLRPGRVDRILSWKKLSSDSLKRFAENYYASQIEQALPDRAYSAAELQSIMGRCPTLEGFLAALSEKN